MTIKERIQALRSAMKANDIAAWIVPGTDPHMNEYLPAHWAEREYISGFTGSAGKIVVTQDMAGLWTDGRYFIQANDELKEGGLELFKEGVAGTPSITDYLAKTLSPKDRVGVNGLILPEALMVQYQNALVKVNIDLVADIDLLAEAWTTDRPSLSDAPLMVLSDEVSGESTQAKLARLRATFGDADAALYTTLDEVAWLYNVRGADVQCNPVVMSYAWVEKDTAIFFVDESKISEADKATLTASGIVVKPYTGILDLITELSAGKVVITDFNKTNHALVAAMCKAGVRNVSSWVALAKAKKNTIELEGTRRAMLKDGVALTQFFMWLESSLEEKTLSEYVIGQHLGLFRAKQADYVGESFDPIVGYKSNGAITHYSASEDNCLDVSAEGMLLLDSGGQYKHGTTDITRTVALGPVSADMKTDFTLVLKGHINLGSAKFPQGTRGAQLDVLARIALWNEGKDYMHGTGHGVGHFLNVHEGPQGIRKEENPTVLQQGMLLSNEPGFYVEGQYGIRIENIVAVQPYNETFNMFENMTLFPIDKRLIDITLLSIEEKTWLNEYHQMVFERVSPLLSEVENKWLRDKTLPILT